MEKKIGEIFEYDNKKLKVVLNLGEDCEGCFFKNGTQCISIGARFGCLDTCRSDHNSIKYIEIKESEFNMDNQKEVKISIPEGYEIDKEKSSFERIIFKKKEKEIKKWIDLVGNVIPLGSCYIEDGGCIFPSSGKFNVCSVNIFIDERHAKSALAMAQIIQLIPYYGGAITDEEWNDINIPKYSLYRSHDKIVKETTYLLFCFLSFHTKEQRNSFYENNEQLAKDYLMIE